MEHRKRVMRCEHPTACESCLDDCRRAEIAAHENQVKDDLLAACRDALKKLEWPIYTPNEVESDIECANYIRGKEVSHKKDCMMLSIAPHPHCTCGLDKLTAADKM